MARLVLVGAGHAHAQVLLDWVTRPVPGVELVLISPSALAPYSGMVPGWLAGTYRFEDICIDFAALARAAGARWVADEVLAFDADLLQFTLRSAGVLRGDLVSINIGSTLIAPSLPSPEVSGTQMLALRPLGELRDAWEALLARLADVPPDHVIDITAVGGGAAGVESLLAVRARLHALRPGRALHSRLLTRAAHLLPGMAQSAARRVEAVLAAAGVDVRTATAFDENTAAAIAGGEGDGRGNGSRLKRTALVLWATGAQAHAWPRLSTLSVSDAGFIHIDAQLRCVSHPQVFAVGDCAEWSAPLPKAGVFAVRMGPVLSHNLRASLGQGELQTYHPQRRYLALLATADEQAIGAWGPWSARGRWVWRWKDHIDRAFLARFEVGDQN